ncbi:MAG: hypothetical protein HQK54_16030, partial [Oligoflexales bacterium]|nr:hypothetical protein [Oligoflexales bacterium]
MYTKIALCVFSVFIFFISACEKKEKKKTGGDAAGQSRIGAPASKEDTIEIFKNLAGTYQIESRYIKDGKSASGSASSQKEDWKGCKGEYSQAEGTIPGGEKYFRLEFRN